jgi:hypothetical protein
MTRTSPCSVVGRGVRGLHFRRFNAAGTIIVARKLVKGPNARHPAAHRPEDEPGALPAASAASATIVSQADTDRNRLSSFAAFPPPPGPGWKTDRVAAVTADTAHLRTVRCRKHASAPQPRWRPSATGPPVPRTQAASRVSGSRSYDLRWGRCCYVNGDPINLIDPTGHLGCRSEASAEDERACNAELSKSRNYTSSRDVLMYEVRHGGVPRGTVYSPDFLQTPEIFNFLLDNRILPVPQTFLDPCTGPAGIGVLPCQAPRGKGYDYRQIASRWFNSEVKPEGEITLAALLLWSGYNPPDEPPPPGEDQDQLQALRQQFANLLHQRELGFDSDIGAWRADEARAGMQLESELGVRLSRATGGGEDWVDQNGTTYDAFGTNLSSNNFNYDQVTKALQRKLDIGASDRIVVDLSQLASPDAQALQGFINNLSDPRVIVLRYGG